MNLNRERDFNVILIFVDELKIDKLEDGKITLNIECDILLEPLWALHMRKLSS